MARKGLSTTADYLPFDELKKLFEGLHKWEAYCKVSYCTAFRISDVRTTRWMDILHQSELIKMEQKTKKSRLITFSQEIADNIAQLYELAGSPDPSLSVICNPHTHQPYSREYINRRLKYFRVRYQVNIRHFSTHSFRKTFARNTFEANGGTMKALSLIQKILNHKNPQTTLIYMGYVQDDINEIYNSLHF